MYKKYSCKSRLVTQGKTLTIVTSHNHDPANPSLSGAIKQFVKIIRH